MARILVYVGNNDRLPIDKRVGAHAAALARVDDLACGTTVEWTEEEWRCRVARGDLGRVDVEACRGSAAEA